MVTMTAMMMMAMMTVHDFLVSVLVYSFLSGELVFYCHCLVCSLFSFYFCLIFAEKLGRTG